MLAVVEVQVVMGIPMLVQVELAAVEQVVLVPTLLPQDLQEQ